MRGSEIPGFWPDPVPILFHSWPILRSLVPSPRPVAVDRPEHPLGSVTPARHAAAALELHGTWIVSGGLVTSHAEVLASSEATSGPAAAVLPGSLVYRSRTS